MTDSALLAHIGRLPHSKASFKHLVKELGSKGLSRAELEPALDRLVERGDLIEYRSGQFVVAGKSREFVTGRLKMHREGYGFLIPDRPIEGISGDPFVSPSSAEGAMHGDRVLARISHIDRDGRCEAEILKIVKRANTTVVGEFRLSKRGAFVVPHDDRLKSWIEIPEGLELPADLDEKHRIGVAEREIHGVDDLHGLIVNVEVLDFPEGDDKAVGRVIEILGHPDDFGVDVEIVIRKHRLPHRFPADVLEQAQSVQLTISQEELKGRRDYREYDIVTIDGETARDFDDAVWVERLPNGNFHLDVHIADVSHYVRPGSPIDREASMRGTSVYFPDRAVPMLPYELSTNICSLNPKVERLVVSARLEIDPRGDVVSQEFFRAVIRSAERMTYTDVHLLLEGDQALRQKYAPLVHRFDLMKELALILNRKRTKRGSIDFDLPEPLIEFDEAGLMVGVSRAPRNIAHRLIEEFMLAANEAVAAHLENAGIAAIYRVHETPDPSRVMEFEETATQFGYSLGIGSLKVKKFGYTDKRRDGGKSRKEIVMADQSVKVTSKHYQKLIASIEGKPEERVMNYLMLRSLKQAKYSSENVGHFALAAETYTHFTSPIRRYPDLIVHRLLTALLDRKSTPEEHEMKSIADQCSFTERRAADAERELVEWKKVKFMEQRVGEVFDGLIVSATRFGLFVELTDLYVEGLVPIDLLPGDRYHFHENVRKIIGMRSKRTFSIGDKVRVCLDRVDPIERKLQFSLAEEAPLGRGRGRHRVERRAKGGRRR